jgi:hypothetical protein
MRVLVACEVSGVVRDAFRARGHDAISCDVQETQSPGPHIVADCRDVICQPWDLVIAFPPCTHLTRAAAHLRKARAADVHAASELVRTIWEAPCPLMCLENPVGLVWRILGHPQQQIDPYQFGHPLRKRTCLWLRGLPPLMSTRLMLHRREWVTSIARTPDRAARRSRTFDGVAAAMADQWGRNELVTRVA